MRKDFIAFLIFFTLSKDIYSLTSKYSNPLKKKDSTQPSIIRADNGYYYLYVAGENIYKSLDLINWEFVGQPFEGVKRHAYLVYESPCITKQGDEYILYFTIQYYGGALDKQAIGVATSKSPEGPFQIVGDDAKLLSNEEVDVRNSIDPYFIQEGGSKYILFGMFFGIYYIELTEDGIGVKDLNSKTQLAGTLFQAPYIYKRMNYYYLFASIGTSSGEGSTYKLVVGRSTHFRGPYTNKDGGSMLNNHYEVILSENTKFIGPGHNARIIVDKDGKTWMIYEALIKGEANIGNVLCMDEIKWTDDGWPYFEGGSPSTDEQIGPNIL